MFGRFIWVRVELLMNLISEWIRFCGCISILMCWLGMLNRWWVLMIFRFLFINVVELIEIFGFIDYLGWVMVWVGVIWVSLVWLWLWNGLLEVVSRIWCMLVLLILVLCECRYWKIVLCLLLIGMILVLVCLVVWVSSLLVSISDFLLVSRMCLLVVVVVRVEDRLVVLMMVVIMVL